MDNPQSLGEWVGLFIYVVLLSRLIRWWFRRHGWFRRL